MPDSQIMVTVINIMKILMSQMRIIRKGDDKKDPYYFFPFTVNLLYQNIHLSVLLGRTTEYNFVYIVIKINY